ncbi:MAG TPA: hypothetical protein VM140_04610 [Burkholderiales bacterium]|nr:hypothetical protein [Burkholderiales bacterium]
MRFFVFFMALAASACSAVKDETSTPVHIVWNRVDDVQAACEGASGRREVFKILGCSKWREASGERTCTIYAPAPRDERDKERFATLGHELMHCTDGNWHDKWGRMTDERVRQAKAAEQSGSAAAGGSKLEPQVEASAK